MSDWWARNKHRYPDNWTEIALAMREAAGWVCPCCDQPHGPGRILTIHHLDHNPPNVEESNLLLCCQVCHLRLGPHIYTKEQAIARLRRRAALDGAQQEMQLG